MPEIAGANTERRFDVGGRADFDEVRRDIEIRLRPVCAQWPAHELFMLTCRMARIKLKYRLRTAVAERN